MGRRNDDEGNLMSTPLTTIGAITLFVDDPRQAKAFYERVFDARLVFEDDDSAAFGFEGTIVNLLATPAARDLVAPGLVADGQQGSRCQLGSTTRTGCAKSWPRGA